MLKQMPEYTEHTIIPVKDIIRTLEMHLQNVLDNHGLQGAYSMDIQLISDILDTIEFKAREEI